MSGQRPALLLALGLFTTLPAPAADLDRAAAARAMRAMPWVGLLVGAVAGAVAAAASALGGGSLLAAATGRPTFWGPTPQWSYIINGANKVAKTDKEGHY